MAPRKITTLRIEDELWTALQAIKDRDGIPISEQVRRAVQAWIEERGVQKSDRKRASTRKRP